MSLKCLPVWFTTRTKGITQISLDSYRFLLRSSWDMAIHFRSAFSIHPLSEHPLFIDEETVGVFSAGAPPCTTNRNPVKEFPKQLTEPSPP